jgi:hypothetical protein
MDNSMIPEVAAGIITTVTIVLIVALNVIRFNKQQKASH